MRSTTTSRFSAADEKGVTMFELLTVILIIGILSATAISNLKELNDPLANASFTVSHFLRLARSRAMSQTSGIRISPASPSRIVAARGSSCSDEDMTPIDDLTLNLPDGAFLVDTAWSFCFTQRGLASPNTRFVLRDEDGQTRTVEIALGGGAQIS